MHGLAVYENVVHVVFKNGRLVDLGEVAAREYIEKRGFSASTIAKYDNLAFNYEAAEKEEEKEKERERERLA